MAIGLQPYNYITSRPDYYSFITDNGAEYICYFSSHAFYFKNYPKLAPKIFDFNIVLKNKGAKVTNLDNRIAATIIKIVGDFLSSKVYAVVYVCDASDGKGLARARKFKTWFNYYEHSSNDIIQINTDMKAGGIKLYVALLVHKKNKLKNKFIEAFLELTDFQDEEK